MRNLTQFVKEHDSSNIEAKAALFYFKALNIKRRDENNQLNIWLNYTYALIRARLAQYLAAQGLMLSYGLHHCGQHNPLNLVDDFFEPWRSIADQFVLSQQHLLNDENFTPADKKILHQIFFSHVHFQGEATNLLPALEQYAFGCAQASRKHSIDFFKEVKLI